MGSSSSQEHKPPATQWFGELEAKLPRMTGKTIAITGTTSGTGQVLARTCAKLGARVLLLNRPSPRADAALKGFQEAKLDGELIAVPCDLQDLASVKQAGAKVLELCPGGLDVLCCNAGVMGLPDKATKDGFDVQMQTNHHSHFLLTHAVLPALLEAAKTRGEARVLQHSSGARNKPDKPIVNAKYYGKNGGNLGGDSFPGMDKWRRYQQSKLANLMFTYSLHDRLHEWAEEQNDPVLKKAYESIKCLCAHPGPTDTGLQAKTTAAGPTTFIDSMLLKSVVKDAHSVEDGSMGITICSCMPEVKSTEFYGPSDPGKKGPAVLLQEERNTENEELLWAESMKALDLKSFFPNVVDAKPAK